MRQLFAETSHTFPSYQCLQKSVRVFFILILIFFSFYFLFWFFLYKKRLIVFFIHSIPALFCHDWLWHFEFFNDGKEYIHLNNHIEFMFQSYSKQNYWHLFLFNFHCSKEHVFSPVVCNFRLCLVLWWCATINFRN